MIKNILVTIKNIVATLILLIGVPLLANGQSCISNISIETECIDAFNYTATLEFDHTLPDGDWVSITDRNGVNFGYFNPNAQPIQLDILLPNSLMNEVGFTLTSREDAKCSLQSPSAFVFCNGCILAANTLSTECIEDTDNYLLSLELTNSGGRAVSSYYVEHNATGTEYGPFDSAVPGEMHTIELELPTSQQGNFTVYDQNRLCHAVTRATNDCAPTTPCSISNVDFETECLDTDNVRVSLEFDFDGLLGDKVSIKDNNGKNYGQFNADQQPLEFDVALLDAVSNELSFTVKSPPQPDCEATSELKTVSCYDCEIAASLVSAECSLGTDNYLLTLEVQSTGASVVGDFKVTHTATGQFIGLFNNYVPNRSRLISMTLSRDLQGDFTVSDANDLCAQAVNAEVDCSIPLCYISDISFETECVDANSFTAEIEFEYEAEVTDMVSVKDVLGNDYGLFDASQQPLSVDVILQDTDSPEFGFILSDGQEADCTSESALQTIECTHCDIQATTISTECIRGNEQYRLTLEIRNNGSSSIEDYTLTHTATGQYIGTFNNYNPDSPRIITAVLSNNLQGSFTIVDSNGQCETTADVQVNCDGPFCTFSNIVFETDCVDANNFSASIEFDYEAEVTEMVSVMDIHGNDYGIFDVGQQPLNVDVVLKDTDSREFGFILTSIQDADCTEVSELQTIECTNCELDARIMHTECENNGETYHMALRVTNLGETNGAKYFVTHIATGQFIGSYSHFGSTNVRHIDFYNTIDLQGEFEIAIVGTNCFTTINLEIDCTPPDSCVLESVNIANTACNDDGTYNLIAECVVSNASDNLVSVSVNGDTPQMHTNTGLITIENVTARDNSDYDTIEICSTNDADCCKTIEFLSPNCVPDVEDCALRITNAGYECDADMADHISFLLEVEGDNASEFVVKVNGVETGSGSLTETLTEVGPIEANTDGSYLIQVVAADNNMCTSSFTLNDAICEEECIIGDVTVTTECLENGLFTASITFPYDANHADGVKIRGNGVNYGTFDGNSQPILLDGLNASDYDQWEFVVIDNQNETCRARNLVGSVDCKDNQLRCLIQNIDTDNLECSGNEEYDMLLNFDIEGEEEISFTYSVNGVALASSTTSSLPLKLTGMSAAGGNEIEVITICLNNLSEECCVDYSYEKPNCLSNSVVDNSLLDGVTISPNPARDVVYIGKIPQEVVGLSIVDNLGRTIKQLVELQDVRIDVSDYQNGLYTIQFFTNENRVVSKRFIKQ